MHAVVVAGVGVGVGVGGGGGGVAQFPKLVFNVFETGGPQKNVVLQSINPAMCQKGLF